MNNKQAKELIEKYKGLTAFFGENNTDFLTGENIISYDSMYDMFRYRMGMGQAESVCIIAALKLSGAKFTGEFTMCGESPIR